MVAQAKPTPAKPAELSFLLEDDDDFESDSKVSCKSWNDDGNYFYHFSHCNLDKMAAILLKISQKYVAKGPIELTISKHWLRWRLGA